MTDPSIVFRTDRLDVRPWRGGEAALLFDIRRRPEVARWMSDGQAWLDVSVATEHIQAWEARAAADDRLGNWAIVPRDLGTPVGTVLLDRLGDGEEVECGWYLHPDHTGHGYASEAARGVLEHAWREGFERVHAIMWPGNEPSSRVCRAIGMRDLGEVPDPWYGTEDEPTSPMFLAERPSRGARGYRATSDGREDGPDRGHRS